MLKIQFSIFGDDPVVEDRRKYQRELDYWREQARLEAARTDALLAGIDAALEVVPFGAYVQHKNKCSDWRWCEHAGCVASRKKDEALVRALEEAQAIKKSEMVMRVIRMAVGKLRGRTAGKNGEAA